MLPTGVAICPNYADALSNRGMAEASLGEDAAAIAGFLEALAIEPGHADAMRQLAFLVQHLGLGEEATCLFEQTLPHCSTAALATPFNKLWVFVTTVDTLRQSAGHGRASFVGQHDIRYDGRNAFFEAATGARSAGFSRNSRGVLPTMGTYCPVGTTGTGVSLGRIAEMPNQAAGSAPLVSVIMPVYNGAATIERALRSLRAQTFTHWEAVAVDDASLDGTWEKLQSAAAADARVRTVRLAKNSGPSAARNAGLRLATGEFIAYLDADDEYYPDYLEQVAAARDKGDVLMFGFDVVYEDGARQDAAQNWDPRNVRRILFSFNPVVPLAAAHRRSLVDKVGGFHELVSRQEDWDLWKRMARAQAKFIFLPGKSGVYHVRPGSLSQTHRLTVRQRETIMANWAADRPIYDPHPNPLPKGEGIRKIAFVSPHCLIDFSSHAAIAMLEGLQLLARAGFDCQAFCGTLLNDDGQNVTVDEVLARWKSPYTVCKARIGPYTSSIIFTAHDRTPITLFQTESPRGNWRDAEEMGAFMTACELFLRKQRPDAAWTYGDDPVSGDVLKLLRRLDIPIVFALNGLTHSNTAMLNVIDYAVVPTELARRHYWETLGLACQVLPPVPDMGKADEQSHSDRLATIYQEFFSQITHQPGPPLVPKEEVAVR